MKRGRLLLVSMAFPVLCTAQERELDDVIAPSVPLQVQVGKVLYKGDSVPHVILPTLNKYPPISFSSKKEQQRYNRLVANVKKVLPIAKLARHTIVETYDFLQTLSTEEEKEAHIRRVEHGIRQQYAPLVKKLTYSQGKLLVKLIDRECNQTSYEIVKAFIGPLRASFYQVFAGLFGNSLTKRYDPEGDDRFTERVVRMVESGQL